MTKIHTVQETTKYLPMSVVVPAIEAPSWSSLQVFHRIFKKSGLGVIEEGMGIGREPERVIPSTWCRNMLT